MNGGAGFHAGSCQQQNEHRGMPAAASAVCSDSENTVMCARAAASAVEAIGLAGGPPSVPQPSQPGAAASLQCLQQDVVAP
eukprot:CAMPEP_0119332082 /NCGR_PEP_ID=MMETSP1333-20130426/82012_1 /TAXON_ID=418940 /ORGANISM="Scyphosphaera apsteinii, Strain RCC1455" /LENGTH=80 /DNA_ID=CAMNT_0007341829 /DNA_START=41 /DNA_END=279 /DNA_ORIENTATION=+